MSRLFLFGEPTSPTLLCYVKFPDKDKDSDLHLTAMCIIFGRVYL